MGPHITGNDKIIWLNDEIYYFPIVQTFGKIDNFIVVNTHFRDTFSTSSIHYYIIFYSFMHDPSPCNILGKLRDCGLEGIDWFISELLHEFISPCMLSSELGTLVES